MFDSKNCEAITKMLLAEGKQLFSQKPTPHQFTGIPEADRLLNDLEHYPHAFVLGCIMDRQVKAERAWTVPYHFAKHIGGFSFDRLSKLSLAKISKIMVTPVPQHRFPESMSENFYLAIQRIGDQWEGDASKIWSDKPSSAAVVYRFLQFHGAGPKIATMAANILARTFKIPFSDYVSIDISVDVQVRRVFERLHLCQRGESNDAIIYLARSINPKFPGLLDSFAWQIGRKWCFATNPNCSDCPMAEKNLCPTANQMADEEVKAIQAAVNDVEIGAKGKAAKSVVLRLKSKLKKR